MDDNRFHAEESLEKRLADAYESMGPDEEARRRMLAELLAASERRAPSAGRLAARWFPSPPASRLLRASACSPTPPPCRNPQAPAAWRR